MLNGNGCCGCCLILQGGDEKEIMKKEGGGGGGGGGVPLGFGLTFLRLREREGPMGCFSCQLHYRTSLYFFPHLFIQTGFFLCIWIYTMHPSAL